jgi:hypothetical protein
MKQIIKRFIAIFIGIFIAIFISVPMVMSFGSFFMTPIILIFLTCSKIDKWLTGRSLACTENDQDALLAAFFFTFGGVALGLNFVIERWNK